MNEKSILVIEDDDGIRETLQLLLELEGYNVFTAHNGREGVEVLRKNCDTSLVFLDLMMPVMNGWEFLAARDQDPTISQIPVIVLTASGLKEKPNGANGIFKKPIELEELLRVTQEYCA